MSPATSRRDQEVNAQVAALLPGAPGRRNGEVDQIVELLRVHWIDLDPSSYS
jgi:hypothetical protein